MSLALQTITSHGPPVAPSALALAGVPCGTVQPVADVAKYLQQRAPVAHWEHEMALFVTLPGLMRIDVKTLQSAMQLAQCHVKGRMKVQEACRQTIQTYRDQHYNLKTFRAIFDLWAKAKDWTVLVNRSKAGAAWQLTRAGLPAEFLSYCEARIGCYKRTDARKEALRSILRQWHTGRTFEGQSEPIPGYGFKADWLKRNPNARRADVPDGWHYSNIMRQIKDRQVLTPATLALLVQGTSAAKAFIPDVMGTREELRFLERVQFDDVKTDWRIFDPATGQAQDLWLLIARDVATTMLLGFGMRPARVREDGTQEHLKLIDMKQLCGWILERYGIPPYLMTWVIENGTATLSKGSAAALQEMLGGRIRIQYASMIGGMSPAGYFEKRIGNSKSKASLESHNRGVHLIGSALPGQTGPSYGKRPADLAAREKECREIALLSEFLPENLRGQVGYSLLTESQARENLYKIFDLQNRRDDHSLEGFAEILEWWDGAKWQPQNTAPNATVRMRRRKEMPIERAARLVMEVQRSEGLAPGHQWSRVSPDLITAFYEHTQKWEKVEPNGEIHITHEGKVLKFVSPDGKHPAPGTRLLRYFHPDDPTYLHLTDGKDSIIGTWLQRGKVKDGDRDALAQAIAHQASAMKAARETAEALNAPEREALDAMRAGNAELMRNNGFVEVTAAPGSTGRTLTSGVAAGLGRVKQHRTETEEAEREHQKAMAALVREQGDAGADAILGKAETAAPSPLCPEADVDSGDDFLRMISARDEQ